MRELTKEFNRKNFKPIAFIVIVLILLAVTAYPQRKLGGTVVEIVDGKTAVIETSTGGKLTVILQFIEIPERDQPLYQTIKEHLEKLILDKTVEFLPRRILTSASAGQVLLGGVDIGRYATIACFSSLYLKITSFFNSFFPPAHFKHNLITLRKFRHEEP